MSSENYVPNEDWTLKQLGEFCVEKRQRMADDAWLMGMAMCLAKQRASKEKRSFTKWKERHGFSNATASRYMRLTEAYQSEEDRQRLTTMGIMEALVAAGIVLPKEPPQEVAGLADEALPGVEGDQEDADPTSKQALSPKPKERAKKKKQAESQSTAPSWAVEDQDADDESLGEEEYLGEMWSCSQTVEEECHKAVPWQISMLRQKAETLLEDEEALRKAWSRDECARKKIKEDIETLAQLLPRLAATLGDVAAASSSRNRKKRKQHHNAA